MSGDAGRWRDAGAGSRGRIKESAGVASIVVFVGAVRREGDRTQAIPPLLTWAQSLTQSLSIGITNPDPIHRELLAEAYERFLEPANGASGYIPAYRAFVEGEL